MLLNAMWRLWQTWCLNKPDLCGFAACAEIRSFAMDMAESENGMAIWLLMAGSMPLILLGGLHLVFTLRDTRAPKILAPRSVDVLKGMQADPLRLTGETTVWRAWIGFNITHSLAVFLTGALTLYLAAKYPSLLEADIVFRWAAPFLAWVYVILARKYWFSRPFYGAMLAAVLMTAAAVLMSI